MTWYLNYYRHRECHTRWTDEWSCTCNDKCPECNAEIEPYNSEDLSIVTDNNGDGTWTVLVSPLSAQHRPDYKATEFQSEDSARQFAGAERKRLIKQFETQMRLAIKTISSGIVR